MTPTIGMKGYRCVVEDYVLGDHNARTHAHLLSLVGTREAVRAIWARLMKQEEAALHAEKLKSVSMHATMGVLGAPRIYTQRLPSGAYHGLLIGNACLKGLVLLSPNEAELPGRFHKHLLERLRLPLHPLWAPWLWDYAISQGYLKKLPSLSVQAYDMAINHLALEQAVRTALVKGELPEIGERRAD